MFQDFIGLSQIKFAEMQDNDKKEPTNISKTMVDAWVVTVAQLFLDEEICGGPVKILMQTTKAIICLMR